MRIGWSVLVGIIGIVLLALGGLKPIQGRDYRRRMPAVLRQHYGDAVGAVKDAKVHWKTSEFLLA